jgi:energy-coupling factor transport system permease protein
MNQSTGYVKGSTFLHRLNPAVKLFALVFALVAAIIWSKWYFSLALLIGVVIAYKIGRIPIGLKTGRIKFLLTFSAFILIVQLVAVQNGIIIFYLFPPVGKIGPYFPVTTFGLERGLLFSLRFMLIVFSSKLFVAVTDPTLLAHAITDLGLPYRYSFALVIALRFVPFFDIETESVRMAQQSRGFSPKIGRPSKLLRTIRMTFYPLLVSALSKANSLAMSMDGRGFGYSKKRTYIRKSTWRATDWLVLVFSIGLLFVSVFLSIGLIPSIFS